MRKRYEYKKIHDPYTEDLNAAGLEGWKVVLQQAKGGYIILMRELMEETIAKPSSFMTQAAIDQAAQDRFTPPYDKNLSSFCSTQGEVIEVPPPTEKDDPGCILERFSIVEAAQAIFLNDKKTSDPILPETLPLEFKEAHTYKVAGIGGKETEEVATNAIEAAEYFALKNPESEIVLIVKKF